MEELKKLARKRDEALVLWLKDIGRLAVFRFYGTRR